MVLETKQMLELYLNNLQVNVTGFGFNQVWTDWRELDYTPDYNKFYFIQDGEGWLKIGDAEFTPKPGQWFLMPQGVRQSYSYTQGPRYTKYWCHFTARIGQTNLFDLLQLSLYIEPNEQAEPLHLFRDLVASPAGGRVTSPLHLKAAMLKLIAYYLEHAILNTESIGTVEHSATMMKVMDYMNAHYRRNITISELAELVHLHPNYLIRVFKQHFGTSPIQYVNRKRIEETKWLLISTDLHLSQISSQVGISDVSYLSRLFKAQTGCSPTAYRMGLRS
ncbi:AraC family transcriptional regulator [Gorillibacterium sp. CAU 1737]|uniref:AraC family transcriptional regulator n=1 Tax=Gorillibacterium sp. CAU 1737 TaxID=3140362 RepID=UPI0032607D77